MLKMAMEQIKLPSLEPGAPICSLCNGLPVAMCRDCSNVGHTHAGEPYFVLKHLDHLCDGGPYITSGPGFHDVSPATLLTGFFHLVRWAGANVSGYDIKYIYISGTAWHDCMTLRKAFKSANELHELRTWATQLSITHPHLVPKEILE